MKFHWLNFFKILFVLSLFFLTFKNPGVALADNSEAIESFEDEIVIQQNGSLLVTEKIVYNFGSHQKHGIFRYIPFKFKDAPQLEINLVDVKDEAGRAYPYSLSTEKGVFYLKIGDPNSLVSGLKTYIIQYEVANALLGYQDYDELYWNVTGNDWSVPIKSAKAAVVLPAPLKVAWFCFTGYTNQTNKNCSAYRDPSNDLKMIFSATRSLNAKEGLTIGLQFDKGYVNSVSISKVQNVKASKDSIEEESWGEFITVLLLFGSYLWVIGIVLRLTGQVRTKTKKPVLPSELKNRPIAVEYQPPDNLSPLEIGMLIDRQVNINDLCAIVIDLARRGYLKIRYKGDPSQNKPKVKDFELIKLKDGSELTSKAEKMTLELLFSTGDTVNLSDLKNPESSKIATILEIADKETEKNLQSRDYFDPEGKKKAENLNSIVNLLLLVLGFCLVIPPGGRIMWFLTMPGLLVYAGIFIVVDIVLLLLGITVRRLISKLTPHGLEVFSKVLGFKEFLELTDLDKLKLLNAPELKPEIFERFLPYAIALGIEDKWTQKFQKILNAPPSWYQDDTAFNSYLFINTMHNLVWSLNNTFSVAFGESTYYEGGGGSSGGGAGGGGGGSW